MNREGESTEGGRFGGCEASLTQTRTIGAFCGKHDHQAGSLRATCKCRFVQAGFRYKQCPTDQGGRVEQLSVAGGQSFDAGIFKRSILGHFGAPTGGDKEYHAETIYAESESTSDLDGTHQEVCRHTRVPKAQWRMPLGYQERVVPSYRSRVYSSRTTGEMYADAWIVQNHIQKRRVAQDMKLSLTSCDTLLLLDTKHCLTGAPLNSVMLELLARTAYSKERGSRTSGKKRIQRNLGLLECSKGLEDQRELSRNRTAGFEVRIKRGTQDPDSRSSSSFKSWRRNQTTVKQHWRKTQALSWTYSINDIFDLW